MLPSKENVGDFAILPNVRRLTTPRIIDPFGRKRCQLLSELFQKYFVVDERSAVKKSFSKYVCYIPGRFIMVESVSKTSMYFDYIEIS